MNILLASAGRRTYMIEYFKDALKGKGLVFASNSILTYSMQQADGYVISPSIYNKDYIGFLIGYCLENKIKAIISLFDIDLLVLAKHEKEFQRNGIKLLVPEEQVVDTCNDKWLTHIFFNSIGLNSPQSYISLPELEKDIATGFIDFPLVLKPRWGSGSIGLYHITNKEELTVLYNKVYREIFESYLKFESEQDPSACILIQKEINGKEYGLDILNDLNGNYVTTIVKQKVAMRAGETDIAEIVDNSIFLDISKKISGSLRHIGILSLDCILSEDGTISVIEMNCRFSGHYPFSHIAGVNFPLQIIKWLEGGSTEQDLVTATVGTVGCKELVPVIFEK